MVAMASLITSLTIVYSTVYSSIDQRKHQSSASLAFVWGIHRWPVNSSHKEPVTRKMFQFDDVIMYLFYWKFIIPSGEIDTLFIFAYIVQGCLICPLPVRLPWRIRVKDEWYHTTTDPWTFTPRTSMRPWKTSSIRSLNIINKHHPLPAAELGHGSLAHGANIHTRIFPLINVCHVLPFLILIYWWLF